MTVGTLIMQLREHNPTTRVMIRSEIRPREINEVKATRTLDLPVSNLGQKIERFVELVPSKNGK